MDVRSRFLTVVTGVLLAVGVACGGDSSKPAETEASKPAAAPATTEAPAPAPAADAAATAAAPIAADAVAAAPATPADAGAIPAAATEEAEKIFNTRCVLCHGAGGKGDGQAAAALNPKPRNYTDKAWQATVGDEEIEKAILGGGTAVGKSNLMPPNPDLATKPDVIRALRAKVRSFGAM